MHRFLFTSNAIDSGLYSFSTDTRNISCIATKLSFFSFLYQLFNEKSNFIIEITDKLMNLHRKIKKIL